MNNEAAQIWFYAQHLRVPLLHARHLVTEPLQSRFISSRADLPEEKSWAEEKLQLTRKILFAIFGFKLAEKSHKIDD